MCFKGGVESCNGVGCFSDISYCTHLFSVGLREKHMIILFTRRQSNGRCHRVTDAILSDTSSTIYLPTL